MSGVSGSRGVTSGRDAPRLQKIEKSKERRRGKVNKRRRAGYKGGAGEWAPADDSRLLPDAPLCLFMPDETDPPPCLFSLDSGEKREGKKKNPGAFVFAHPSCDGSSFCSLSPLNHLLVLPQRQKRAAFFPPRPRIPEKSLASFEFLIFF